MQLNPHYAELNESYLFSTIAHKVADYQKAHPEADVIRLGIGDVTLPLAASVTEAMHKAVEEQGHKETFHGYIPSEQGYVFLREAIRKTIPLGRMASVDDIVRTALFLASDVSSYLTGQSLNLSGGMITEV